MRIGQQFDDLAARNTLRVDRTLVADAQAVVADYTGSLPASAQSPVVAELAQEIIGSGRARNLTGRQYQLWRSHLERTARNAGGDANLSGAVRELRIALDDAMERSMTNPADAAAWTEARRQYRNLIVVEQAATGAGEAAGIITPAKLREATISKQGRRNYARGTGDFADLTRDGEAVMTPLPNSRSAPRFAAQAIPDAIGAALGGPGGPAGVGAGAAVGAILGPAVAGLISWIAFCEQEGISPTFPVDPAVVKRWLRALYADNKAAATILAYHTALRMAANNAGHPIDHRLIAATLKAIRGRSRAANRAAPLLGDDLATLTASANTGRPADVRDIVMMLIGFAGGPAPERNRFARLALAGAAA